MRNTEKRDVILYNLLFPVWMFFLIPSAAWLLILPGNFVIDSLVLLLAMRHYHLENKMALWKKSILRVWIVGFVSDFLGALLSFPIFVYCAPAFDPTRFPAAQLIVLPGITFAGLLIYLLNACVSFNNSGLEKAQINKLCTALAVFTAPYTMLWPWEWTYF